jgi:hypothetical protein
MDRLLDSLFLGLLIEMRFGITKALYIPASKDSIGWEERDQDPSLGILGRNAEHSAIREAGLSGPTQQDSSKPVRCCRSRRTGLRTRQVPNAVFKVCVRIILVCDIRIEVQHKYVKALEQDVPCERTISTFG